jgi:hypothetical protein
LYYCFDDDEDDVVDDDVDFVEVEVEGGAE